MGGLRTQPPPRGCVLKPHVDLSGVMHMKAAASARLCVETSVDNDFDFDDFAAASARLCVETDGQSIFGTA